MSPGTALITGAGGQDGRLLTRLLRGEGWRVLAAARAGSGPSEADAAVPWPDDEPRTWRQRLDEHRVGVIYHLGGMTFSPDCEADPAAATAALALRTAQVLDAAAAAADPPRVVLASSCEIFGRPERSPQDERTPIVPRTVYGCAKAFAHQLAQWYRERRGLFAANAILYPHESPLRRGPFLSRKVVQATMAASRGSRTPLVLGNLDAKRDWTDAEDIVRGLACIAAHHRADDWILASGRTHRVRDWCAHAYARFGLDWTAHVVTDPALMRTEGIRVVGDAGKARRELGWEPRIGFGAMLDRLLDAETQATASR